MKTITLNDQEFEFESYSRNTHLNIEESRSFGSITNLKKFNLLNILYDLSSQVITYIQIKKDNQLIYSLNNIQAKIIQIDEFVDDEELKINLLLEF